MRKHTPSITILLALLLSFGSATFTPANAAGPVDLTPETSGISNARGDIPFYSQFSRSTDGRVIAQIFSLEDTRQLILSFSNNFGATWSSKSLGRLSVDQSGPRVMVSGDGSSISAFWLDGTWNQINSVMWNVTSSDSGQSWGSPTLIGAGIALSKMQIKWVAGSESGKDQMVVFLTEAVSNSTDTPQHLYIGSSNDFGRTWRVHQSTATGLLQLYGDAIVSSDGRTMSYIYESYGNKETRGAFNIATSVDGGKTWSSESRSLPNPSGSTGLKFVSISSEQIIILDPLSAILLSVDKGISFKKLTSISGYFPKTIVSNSGSSIIVVTTEITASERKVVLTRTDDRGLSWVKMNPLASAGQFINMAASADLKTIAVVMIDGSNATYIQISSDGGVTWSAPKNLLEERRYLMKNPSMDFDMNALIFNESKKQFYFAYQELATTPRVTSSLRGVDIKLASIELEGNGSSSEYFDQTYLVPLFTKYNFSDLEVEGTREHYSFAGWSLEPEGITYVTSGHVIEGDMKVYAQWEPLPKYAISYVSNGILSKALSKVSFWSDEDISVSAALGIKNGYGFAAWNTSKNGSGTEYLPGDRIYDLTSDLTLYAIGGVKSTIICSNGKSVKKVNGFKPTCPTGYKKR